MLKKIRRRCIIIKYKLKSFKPNIRIGKVSQFIFPKYSSCGECNTTWNIVKPHCTSYTKNKGCFPLCEKCWNKLTIEERLPHYKKMWERWRTSDKEEWTKIEKAVWDGK